MRIPFLAIVFVLAAGCARADQIDNVVTNLPDDWHDGPTPVIILPQTTPVGQLLTNSFHCALLDDCITNYSLMMSRQVTLTNHGFWTERYLAVLVRTKRGEKLVLFKSFDLPLPDGTRTNAWWSRVFDAK